MLCLRRHLRQLLREYSKGQCQNTSLSPSSYNHKKPRSLAERFNRTPTRKTPPVATSQKQEPPNPLRYRTIPIVFGSITLFGLSAYCTYLYTIYSQPISPSAAKRIQDDVSSRYDTIARSFDEQVDWTEYLMGITKLRKELAQQAAGDVLEVSIGTGRNLSFYDWDFKGYNGIGKLDQQKGGIRRGKVKSFTAIDKSSEMLEVAHEKFSRDFPGILGVRWILQDAASERIPGPPRSADERSGNKDAKYDTVVQTMGLCSVADPVGLLRNLGECVKEDTGRILLLEHGKGTWEWLNKILDKGAEKHAYQFGCWWNRELGEIVRESGLEVVKMARKHGGTTWWIELRKPKGQESEKGKTQEVNVSEKMTEGKGDKKGWW